MFQGPLFSSSPLAGAKELHSVIKLGTSSWNYPGWKGLVYLYDYPSEKSFKENSLKEYASYPLFKTVGIDSSHYSPLTAKILKSYASQVPEDFSWVSKVWERITIHNYPSHARYGGVAGKKNSDFLNADLFKDRVLSELNAEEVLKRHGPMVFQFQQMSREVLASFPEKLAFFLSQLPRDFQYAVEIRNKELLTKEYIQALNLAGATHCFSHWSYMPGLKDQMIVAATAGGLNAPFFVARLLTPLNVRYQDAVERFKPYDQIIERQTVLREDLSILFKRAMERQVVCYVLVNNRLEGCSPQTILEISNNLSAEL